ncbi:unnamed protein product [Spirodela intermedia]|uniref:Uncharacterized protein n=1 Tax=Spirodela intermedia TaxID=51605 RepID=A0A7I8LDD0_SPIIN|nr:unnamed protein product [Spirodela intermedia]
MKAAIDASIIGETMRTGVPTVVIAILDHQVINKGGCNHVHHNTFYLVQWAGQPREAAT